MMTINNVKNILCTGAGGASGYAMLKSLLESDLNINLFAGDMYQYSAGAHINGVTGVQLPPASEESFSDELLRISLEHKIDVVICSPEPEVLIMSKLREQWYENYKIQVVTTYPETAYIGVNKLALYEKLKDKEGIYLKPFLDITNEEDIYRWSHGFPCVIKPYSGVSARGLHYVNNVEEFVLIYRYLTQHLGFTKLVLQGLIPGLSSNVYTVGALYWNGSLINAGIHHKLRTTPTRGGSAVAGITIESKPLLEYGLHILNSAGKWHGCVAVEFKVSEKDNLPYLLEINPRLWGFSYLMTMAGVNYPEMLVRLSQGQYIPTFEQRDHRFLVYEIGKKMIRGLDLMEFTN